MEQSLRSRSMVIFTTASQPKLYSSELTLRQERGQQSTSPRSPQPRCLGGGPPTLMLSSCALAAAGSACAALSFLFSSSFLLPSASSFSALTRSWCSSRESSAVSPPLPASSSSTRPRRRPFSSCRAHRGRGGGQRLAGYSRGNAAGGNAAGRDAAGADMAWKWNSTARYAGDTTGHRRRRWSAKHGK